MTGQSDAAAERSAHVTRGGNEKPGHDFLVEVAPGVFRLKAVVRAEAERDVERILSRRLRVEVDNALARARRAEHEARCLREELRGPAAPPGRHAAAARGAIEQHLIDTGVSADATNADGILAALREAGYAVVPRQPTPGMLKAAHRSTSGWLGLPGSGLTQAYSKHAIRYRAMITAAEGGE